MSAPITFVVPGVRADGPTRGVRTAAPPPIGHPKDSVTVTAQRAAGESEVRTTAIPGEDIIIVHIAGGPELWLHPESARELLLSQRDPLIARGGAEAPLAPGEVRVPARLQWRLEEVAPTRGATRGFLGDVLVRAIQVITGIGEDKAADFVASKVVHAFDCQVDPGVYQLEPHKLEVTQRTAAVTDCRKRQGISGADPRDVQPDRWDVRKVMEGASTACRSAVRKVSQRGIRP